MNKLRVSHKRVDDELLMRKRREELDKWPTGKEVDFDEAVAYQKSLPDSKIWWKVMVKLREEGRQITRRYAHGQRLLLDKYLLTDRIADKPLSSITRADVLEFRSRLAQLLGSKVAEIRRFGGGEEIYRLLSALRIKGCDVVGVHAGTGVVAAYVRGEFAEGCASMLHEIAMPFTICRSDSRGMTVQFLE